MAQELKDHQACMDKMLGDDFKNFSCRAGRKEWKALTRGNFNSDRQILEDENLPAVVKKADIVGEKW